MVNISREYFLRKFASCILLNNFLFLNYKAGIYFCNMLGKEKKSQVTHWHRIVVMRAIQYTYRDTKTETL